MASQTKIVISASRRTDIPAFYLKWFMAQLDRGYFKVTNPYNRHVSIVPATPEKVHTIVFWSKNFNAFLKNDIGGKLQDRGYNLFFNFSINSAAPLLEPHVPPLSVRLDQLENLSRRFGAQAIHWRFDPICFYTDGSGRLHDNLQDFARIADKAYRTGIERCLTSFMDHYPKIGRRTASKPGFDFCDPPLEHKIATILEMENRLKPLNIRLYTCCEKEIIAALPPESLISPSACIPGDLLEAIYGGTLILKRDAGQRIKRGCQCTISSDIGSYDLHPCYHNCLFCYANPKAGLI
jgi:hypothetical protein